MKLITVRLRGIGPAPATGWFSLDPVLTLGRIAAAGLRDEFLRLVESLNPAYRCETVRPFSHYPDTIVKNGYRRAVNPAKHSAAIGVFAATPELIRELGGFDPALYQTDRVEIGRRLDCSLWSNFVELPSSTRWGEISPTFLALFRQHRETCRGSADLAGLLDELSPADRLGGTIMTRLDGWLESLEEQIGTFDQLTELRQSVRRAEHFHSARDHLKRRLPLTLRIAPELSLPRSLQVSNRPAGHGTRLPIDYLSRALLLELQSRRERHHGADADLTRELEERLSRLGFPKAVTISPCRDGMTLFHRADADHNRHPIGAPVAFMAAAARMVTGSWPVLLFDAGTKIPPDLVLRFSKTCQVLALHPDPGKRLTEAAGTCYRETRLLATT